MKLIYALTQHLENNENVHAKKNINTTAASPQ